MNRQVNVVDGEPYGGGTTADKSDGEIQHTSTTSATPVMADEAQGRLSENETTGGSFKPTLHPVPTTAGSKAEETGATSDEQIEETKYGMGKPKRVIVRARLIHD